jgi:hypothetical protein
MLAWWCVRISKRGASSTTARFVRAPLTDRLPHQVIVDIDGRTHDWYKCVVTRPPVASGRSLALLQKNPTPVNV